jgi:hypothetical protein
LLKQTVHDVYEMDEWQMTGLRKTFMSKTAMSVSDSRTTVNKDVNKIMKYACTCFAFKPVPY